MYAEALDGAIGLDVTSELIVSGSGFSPDDVMIASTCPRCGGRPTALSSQDFAGGARLEVEVEEPVPDRIELKSSGVLSCECRQCGSIYCVFVFGPGHYGASVITGYFTIVENRFLDRMAYELEALTRRGRRPDDVDEWAAQKLAAAIVEVLALMDRQAWLITGSWKELKYRKKWAL